MLKMRILYLLWLNARGGLLAFTEPSACTTNSTSTSVKSAAPVQRSRSGMGKMIGVEHIYIHISYTMGILPMIHLYTVHIYIIVYTMSILPIIWVIMANSQHIKYAKNKMVFIPSPE